MFTIEVVKEFLGWSAVINISLLSLSVILLMVMRGFILGVHKKMSGLSEPELLRLYFEYLGNYKILIIVFNIVPYVALCVIS